MRAQINYRQIAHVALLCAIAGCSQTTQEPGATPLVETKTVKSVAREGAATAAPADLSAKQKSSVETFDTHRLLLLSSKPILVEVQVSANGKAPSQNLDAVIDYVLAAADSNSDNKPTWAELMTNESFVSGPLVMQSAPAAADGQSEPDPPDTDSWPSQYDTNTNQVVDREEVVPFVMDFQFNEIVTFTSGPSYGDDQQYESTILKVVDANKNEQFDDDELESINATLMRYDYNDDECIAAAELAGPEASPEMVDGMMMAAPTSNNGIAAIRLFRDRAWIRTHFLLKKRYGIAGKIPADAMGTDLFVPLDVDDDGNIDEGELSGLWSTKPHIAIQLRLDSESGTLTSKDPAFEAVSDSAGLFRLDELAFQCGITASVVSTDSATETEPTQQQLLANARSCLVANRIQLSVDDHQDAVFSFLDRNGDGRLSLREVRNAESAIGQCDKNGDGKIFVEEIAPTMQLHIERGGDVSELTPDEPRRVLSPQSSDAPDWFAAMDRNGDGELSPSEFLGRVSQFDSFDTNNDGVLSAAESVSTEE